MGVVLYSILSTVKNASNRAHHFVKTKAVNT